VVMSAGGERTLARGPIARAYLPKPLDLTQLLSVVTHHARRDRSPETRRVFRQWTSHHVSTHRMRVPTVLAVTGDQAFLDEHLETIACGGAVLRSATPEDAVARAGDPGVVALLVRDEASAAWLRTHVDSRVRVLVAPSLSAFQLEAAVRAAVRHAGHS